MRARAPAGWAPPPRSASGLRHPLAERADHIRRNRQGPAADGPNNGAMRPPRFETYSGVDFSGARKAGDATWVAELTPTPRRDRRPASPPRSSYPLSAG